MSRYKSTEEQPTESHSRQNTWKGSLTSLSRYLSSCLCFGGRPARRGNTLEFEDSELQLDRYLVERALCRHFDDPSIKVLYFRFLAWPYLFPPGL